MGETALSAAAIAAQEIVRRGLASLLADALPSWRVAALDSYPPDPVGFDLLLVQEELLPSPLERLPREAPSRPERVVVPVVSTRAPEHLLARARLHPRGFVHLDDGPAEFALGVKAALEGRRHLPAIAREALADTALDRDSLIRLTRRELDVMRLAAGGGTARSIADELFISDSTVKGHLREVYRKVAARNRAAAIAKLVALGLLMVDTT